jgi:arylsulfatase/arylsulfatase A
MSDDQGIGDFGITGNPIVQTPFIDKMARNSASLNRFYVNAVCSPTRSSLMTGRWSYRTGVTDTFKGRSIMSSEETTIAEVLKEAGYATALFGKWHLGDTYPYRPMEQGFETAIYHRGGGLAQPSEPIEADRRFTDPVLFRNGEQYTAKGFCCDVYFSEAIEFIKKSKDDKKPFFAYVASNTPHSPFHDVPEKWLNYYKGLNLENSQFPQDQGHPISGPNNLDDRARIFAMVSNLDENVGRLFSALDDMDLTENTLVIYMCDNGPNGNRYVTGFKGRKSSAHEGGVRSPFWAHWPKVFKPGTQSDHLAAHVDVFPTLLEACGIDLPEGLSIDGQSMLGLLKGESSQPEDRTVFLQSHRGEKPEPWENATVLTQQWKLVNNGKPGNLELFNLSKDPFAQNNVISDFPQVRSELENEYDTWIEEMRQINPVDLPIFVGTEHEPETALTIQDWKVADQTGWGVDGEWRLNVVETGAYEVSFNSKEYSIPFAAKLIIDDKEVASLTANTPQERYTFPAINLEQGRSTLKVALNSKETAFWHVFVAKEEG